MVPATTETHLNQVDKPEAKDTSLTGSLTQVGG